MTTRRKDRDEDREDETRERRDEDKKIGEGERGSTTEWRHLDYWERNFTLSQEEKDQN